MISQATASLIIALFGGSLGQLLMKVGIQNGDILNGLLFWQNGFNLSTSGLLALGIISYLVSMFFWIHALKTFPLSFAYPVLALSYVIVSIGAAYWPGLNESLQITKMLGLLFIIIGVYFCTLSPNSKPVESNE